MPRHRAEAWGGFRVEREKQNQNGMQGSQRGLSRGKRNRKAAQAQETLCGYCCLPRLCAVFLSEEEGMSADRVGGGRTRDSSFS